MGFRCGIVGLPNVGKSTLFNALTRTAAAQAANYPFCTIEPNTGEVAVPDPRLTKLAEFGKSAQIVPTRLTFVDIAGLVRGASKGEGLGNQFLANIREVDAIAHVVRCFEDPDVVHVEGHIDPLADIETVETELMLADLDSLERRVAPLEKRAKSGDKEAIKALEPMQMALDLLREGKPARLAWIDEEHKPAFKALNLLTSKRVLYICNVDEASAATGNRYSRMVEEMVAEQEKHHGPRPEHATSAPEHGRSRRRRRHLRRHRGGDRPACRGGAARVPAGARAGGARPRPADPRRLRAPRASSPSSPSARRRRAPGRCPRGTKAPQAAGAIHTDFERGFIRAQTIAYDDFVALGGEVGAKEAGKARDEGKDYVVQDGDVMLFKFNV